MNVHKTLIFPLQYFILSHQPYYIILHTISFPSTLLQYTAYYFFPINLTRLYYILFLSHQPIFPLPAHIYHLPKFIFEYHQSILQTIFFNCQTPSLFFTPFLTTLPSFLLLYPHSSYLTPLPPTIPSFLLL